ncbi:hypothetical protein HRI_001378500 [Hibiscus trionum]|uniref:Uncharacterized protein n=1 Tax=Hibiscus trionum TaxID=183268 RepID=A0A9W7HGP5_HIBTR|nr:hypothetical protein HRI_001378500 [Hibiscus trionum]
MGTRKLVLLLPCLLLLLLSLFSFAEARGSSRFSHTLNIRPKSTHEKEKLPNSFVGALPKSMPIPPSAPSKKHNDIGLQSSTTFP